MVHIPERRIAGAAIALMAALLFGNQGFRRWWTLRESRTRLTAALETLRSDHAALTQELERLQEDPGYTEYLIRKHLGYIKKNEVEYRVLKKN